MLAATEIYASIANLAQKLNSLGNYAEGRDAVLNALKLQQIGHLIDGLFVLVEGTDLTWIKTMQDMAAASGLIRGILSRSIAKQYRK